MTKINHHKYVGLKIRLMAHIIDVFLLFLIMFILLKLLDPLPYDHSIIFKEISGLILSALYYTVFTSSSKQGTIGKQVMGIKVVNASMNRLSLLHSFGRYLAYYFSYITLGLGFIMISFAKKHMGLHDRIAHTYVVLR